MLPQYPSRLPVDKRAWYRAGLAQILEARILDKLLTVIVRQKNGSFVLVKQHDHALAAAEFAKRWATQPRPLESTLYAVAYHDVAWQGPDAEVRWNEASDRPYSFADYPAEKKVEAYTGGLDWLEEQDPYAALLCSRHYETLMRTFGESEVEKDFAEAEALRQERLREGVSGEGIENLDRNLSFLRLCDGLSLFVCLNEPGDDDYPPPYPGGFAFEGETYEPVWEDERTLRLAPNPFTAPFELEIPYQTVGEDRRALGSGLLEIRVVTSD